jgi:hypothetical protein
VIEQHASLLSTISRNAPFFKNHDVCNTEGKTLLARLYNAMRVPGVLEQTDLEVHVCRAAKQLDAIWNLYGFPF